MYISKGVLGVYHYTSKGWLKELPIRSSRGGAIQTPQTAGCSSHEENLGDKYLCVPGRGRYLVIISISFSNSFYFHCFFFKNIQYLLSMYKCYQTEIKVYSCKGYYKPLVKFIIVIINLVCDWSHTVIINQVLVIYHHRSLWPIRTLVILTALK